MSLGKHGYEFCERLSSRMLKHRHSTTGPHCAADTITEKKLPPTATKDVLYTHSLTLTPQVLTEWVLRKVFHPLFNHGGYYRVPSTILP